MLLLRAGSDLLCTASSIIHLLPLILYKYPQFLLYTYKSLQPVKYYCNQVLFSSTHMFSLLARRALRLKIAPRVTLSSNFKFSSTRSVHSSGRRLVPHLGRIGLASGVVLGGSLLVATHVTDSTNSTVRDANRPPDRKPVPLPTLLRSYIVYTMCSVPALVDWSPTVLSILMTIPIVRDVTEAIVRLTFFAQVTDILSCQSVY